MTKKLLVIIAVLLPVLLLIALAASFSHSPSLSPGTRSDSGVDHTLAMTPTYLDGALMVGETDPYSLDGEAGQTLLVALDSPDRGVIFSLEGFDRQVLWDGTSVFFLGTLPATQSYSLSVTSIITDAPYRLSYQLYPGIAGQNTTKLKPNEDGKSIIAKGSIEPGQIPHYAFDASAGDLVLITTWNSIPEQVVEMVIGADDGTALFGGNFFWIGEMPESQTYSVSLRPFTWPTGVSKLDYELSVEVFKPHESREPQTVHFSGDRPLVALEGEIDSGGTEWGRNRYYVTGTAGETLTVTVSSEDEGSFVVSLRGGDGSLLVGDAIVLTGYSDTPTQDLTTILPTSQEYVITVIGKDNSHYTLEMELQHK